MTQLASYPGVAHYYVLPAENAVPFRRRSASLLTVLGIHLLVLVAIGYAAVRQELPSQVRALAVRLIEPAPPAPPRIEAPKPLPPKAPPRKVTPPPVLAAAPSTNAAPAFFVSPQPEPTTAPLVQAPAPVPVTAARFDADYLQNPRPAYPPISRRLGEEGKVVLRVRVSAQGTPLAVDIRQSSGFSRLDEAAKAAVERWRFVPARQGDQPIESSVLVPLNFTLSN
jgi:protein TonB